MSYVDVSVVEVPSPSTKMSTIAMLVRITFPVFVIVIV